MSSFARLRDEILGPGGEGAPAETVDLAAVLGERAAEHAERPEWRRSIVELMQLLGLDASYGSRKELALELGYSLDEIVSKGSAEMNIWLHKAVMRKLAECGAKVPGKLLE